jgi:hypothetical protein
MLTAGCAFFAAQKQLEEVQAEKRHLQQQLEQQKMAAATALAEATSQLEDAQVREHASVSTWLKRTLIWPLACMLLLGTPS